MTKFLTIFLLLIAPNYIYGQKSYDIYEDAKYLYLLKSNEYKNLADSILDKEIAKGTKNFKIYLLKSRFLYEKGESSVAFPLLIKAVKYGCDFHHHIFTNNFFKTHISKSDSLEIEMFAQKNIEIPFQSANKQALTNLYELVNWDQAITWFWKKNHDSICVNLTQYRVLYKNTINELLLDYLNNFGYPDVLEFGEDLVNRFDIVIIHQGNWEWLKPFYDNAFENNKISPAGYYNFYDGILIEKDLPQIYGALENSQLKNGKLIIYPIDNIKSIDSLRNSVNLSPLHVFLKNNNLEIPEGYSYDINAYTISVRNKLRKH